MSRRTAPPPRNYFGIPESGSGRRERPPAHHDRLLADPETITGAVELGIRVLEPVHVGSGAFGLHQGRVVKEPVRRRELLVIPGSSLKGMCRQIVEALTASDSPFDPRARYRAPPHGDPPRPVSAASALFGALGYQGRVSFDDAVPAEALHPEEIALSVPYPPQKPVGRRFYGDPPRGADQPPSIGALAIPGGSLLLSTLRFRNLDRRELGEVFLGLGVDRFAPRLGGGKYDGFGRVEIVPRGYRLRPRGFRRSRGWQRDSAELTAFVDGCLGAVELDASAREVLSVLQRKLPLPAPGEDRKDRP
ncbi:MAG: RAMP superfamily CRISPR-associated protein [Thermoanaerobaculia bacterium]